MSPSQEEKIQEVIEKSGFIALISEEGAGEEILLAKEALKIILEDKGLKVCQFPERSKELENKWSFILPAGEDNHFLYSTSILIPKNKINIQEISYSVVRNRYQLIFESVLKWSQRRTTIQHKLAKNGIGQYVDKWKIKNKLYSPHPKLVQKNNPPSEGSLSTN